MKLEGWANIATIATAFGIWVAIIQLVINKKHLHLDTIKRCIDEFRALTNPKDTNYCDKDASRYIDLVNEEIFYFQHGYIPKIIALEWIDGILDYLPLFAADGSILNGKYCVERIARKHEFFLKDYPRIKHAFTIMNDFDVELVYSQKNEEQHMKILMRKNLSASIYENVKRFDF